MPGDADIAAVAALIGDRTRARILLELLGGKSLRASELAATAQVSRPTASFHLGKLLQAELVQRDRTARGYRLAGPRVAAALEALQRLAPRQPINSLRVANAGEALAYARFCYDHLAGRLAVQLVEAMTDQGLIELAGDRFELRREGESRLTDLGVDLAAARARRRSFSRSCLDWSERRPHLAGALGAALAHRLLELGWIERTASGRAVRLTPSGRRELPRALGVEV